MGVKCDIEISEYIVRALGIKKSEINDVLRQELAVSFFHRGLLSFGQARQFAGLTVWDFIELLRERKIPLRYDLLEYEEDLKTIKGLL